MHRASCTSRYSRISWDLQEQRAFGEPPPNGMGPLGYPVTIGEFFGGLGLIVGFLCRFSAASLILIMGGAIALVHGQDGFFLGHGPSDTLATSGFEYNLALIGLLTPILIAGPGSLAVGPTGTGLPRVIFTLSSGRGVRS